QQPKIFQWGGSTWTDTSVVTGTETGQAAAVLAVSGGIAYYVKSTDHLLYSKSLTASGEKPLDSAPYPDVAGETDGTLTGVMALPDCGSAYNFRLRSFISGTWREYPDWCATQVAYDTSSDTFWSRNEQDKVYQWDVDAWKWMGDNASLLARNSSAIWRTGTT